MTAADSARLAAFLAALTVGGTWSLTYLAAVGYWLVTGRGPGGRLLAASGSGSGTAGTRALRQLAAQQRSGAATA